MDSQFVALYPNLTELSLLDIPAETRIATEHNWAFVSKSGMVAVLFYVPPPWCVVEFYQDVGFILATVPLNTQINDTLPICYNDRFVTDNFNH